MDFDAVFQPGRIDIEGARFRGPDFAATVSGIWKWRDTKDVDLRVAADSRLEVLDRLGYMEEFGSGPVHFEGSLRRRPGEWYVEGDYRSPGVTILGRHLSPMSGRAAGDQEALRLDIDSSQYGGGTITGDVLISMASEGSRPVTVDLDLADVSLTRLLRDQAIPVEGLAARVSGPIRYEFARALPRRGDGSGDLDVRETSADTEGALEVWGAIPLVIRDGVLRSDSIRLNSESQVFLATGEYDLSSSEGTFDFSIATRMVQELFSAGVPSGQ